MYKMCHVCGVESIKLDEYKKKQEDVNSLGLAGGVPIRSCKFCGEKYGQESLRQDVSTPYATPIVSPAISLKSFDSFVSSCSDFSVDATLYGRGNEDERPSDTNEENIHLKITGDLQNLSSAASADGIDRSKTIIMDNIEGVNNDENINTAKDIQILGISDSQEVMEDVVDRNDRSSVPDKEGVELSQAFDIEMDPNIWSPPEPIDPEDDIECSFAKNDDDECSGGMTWSQPSSLNGFGTDGSLSFRFKQERQKAMYEVMNVEFKALVNRLLILEGIDISGEPGENWVDIVTSLSWEAALLVKPDANEDKAMDPEGYVKVKCIATGSPNQSQVIRGLVFKKNAAHKRMPTKHKSPRLLLLQGLLGKQSSGLFSFESMEQEKENLKSIAEMIELCHPNVVLVEKTVPRDLQEFVLAKGITLVLDMKRHRLERIARCTGSQIASASDNLTTSKLKHCDSFHFEKFDEEHYGSKEDGKLPKKTLMFLEGFHKPIGCTVLLKGTHNNELKKIKCVLQCAVVVAYHLILETSFLLDHKVMFSTISSGAAEKGEFLTDEQLPIISSKDFSNSGSSCLMESSAESDSFCNVDIPITVGLCNGRSMSSGLVIKDDSALSGSNPDVNVCDSDMCESSRTNHSVPQKEHGCQGEKSDEIFLPTHLPGQFLSSLSSSLKKVLGDNFLLVSPPSYQSISTFLNEREHECQNSAVPILTPPDAVKHCEMEAKGGADELKLPNGEQAQSLSFSSEAPLDNCKADVNEGKTTKDGVSTVSDSQSILVLLSSRNLLRGTICEQSHLSRIMYYRNFDVSLGQFLRNNLLNQKCQCSACGEPSEAHVYCYAHHNGKLTIRVKRLQPHLRLPCESEGKLWMWMRCFKCKLENGIPKSTRRVVISPAARNLSFGKFLELILSKNSMYGGLSSCGHAHSDYIRFYGLGDTVAMFRYSLVETYAAAMPPRVLEFNNPIPKEWLRREAEDVRQKGLLLFSEVANSLQQLKSRFSSSPEDSSLNPRGSAKQLSEIEAMLWLEKSDFEARVKKASDKNGYSSPAVYKLLSLNRLLWELLIEKFVWDRRLYLILSSNSTRGQMGSTDMAMHEEKSDLQDDAVGGRFEGKINFLESGDKLLANGASSHITPIISKEGSSRFSDMTSNCDNDTEAGVGINKKEVLIESDEISEKEVPTSDMMYEVPVLGSGYPDDEANGSTCVQANKNPSLGNLNLAASTHGDHNLPTTCRVGSVEDRVSSNGSPDGSSNLSCDENGQEEYMSFCNPLPNTNVRHTSSVANGHIHGSTLEDFSVKSGFKEHCTGIRNSDELPLSNIDDSEGWIWAPFRETCKAYLKDLKRGNSQKFEYISSYTPECLSSAQLLTTQEGSRMHILFGPDDNILSDYEDEYSSLIACALALVRDRHGSSEDLIENETGREKGETANVSETAHIKFTRPYWSSTSSLDSDGSHSVESISSEESSLVSFDGLNSMDTPYFGTLHPEISFGVGKLPGKSKYSVVCLYANQFHALRRRCCPGELDYIASLSRCKKWDAKGGKSKSFFAKTLDDRFILKEIKRTELDSFLKFAPHYFKHMNESFDSGSQTCLAKILGIYQVIIRQPKSGKEMRHDLMVMENLTFGRNITRMYDLKGALHARYASCDDGPGTVFLDQNFVDDMHISPLYVSAKTRHLLQRAVWNDTSFLTSINVMDYSLLVGVDNQRHELVCGIIDYLRQYTWDKHLETWVKTSLVVPKNVTPTVISPKEYKKRFRKFMSLYFLSIPDHWSLGVESDDSSQSKTMDQREAK